MAEKSSFFTSLNGDRRYKASDFAEYFSRFIGDGVFPNPSTGLQVTANNDMTLTLNPGYAWIKGYMYSNTDILTLTVDASDSALKRIDRVVVKCDYVNREIRTYVKKGAFSQNPVAPILERGVNAYEICVADIQIDPGVISIQQSKITDTRLNFDLCGIVTQTINEIDTTTLYNQLQAHIEEKSLDMTTWIQEAKEHFNTWLGDTKTEYTNEFNTWFDSVKGALDGDVAGNLLNKINALEEIVNNMELTSTKVLRPNKKTVEESISATETSIQGAQRDIEALQQELNGQVAKGTESINILLKKING